MSATIFRRGGKTKLFGVLFASGEMRFVVRFAVGDAHMLHTRYILRKYMYKKKQKKLRALREVSGGGPLHVLPPRITIPLCTLWVGSGPGRWKKEIWVG